MRVLVAADAMAGLDPRGASEVIAQAFADLGAQVAVVPLSDGGPWFAGSVAAFDDTARVLQPASLAEVVEAVTAPSPVRYLDLTTLAPHTWDELVSVPPESLAALHLADLVAVVRSGTQRDTLTGLTGAVAERGRRDGVELGDTLTADTRVSRWCEAIGVSGDMPGSGAADGVGALIAAVGGRITSGIDVCVDGFDVASTMAKADLIVTGSSVLDFHAVGGDVVKEVAALAGKALRPVIAIVGRNFVSARELRLGGIESAHPLLDGAGDDEPGPERLAGVASKVARSWNW